MMRCEVVAIGTELLLGQIVDSNSSWIGEQLALAGIDSLYQVKVGDNAERMKSVITQALERSDAVICCGGLGPTQDDITREVIADIMGVELVRDEVIVDSIRAMFESRGREMSDNNKRQADIPVGAATIKEMPGTAPGLLCPVGEKVIYAVPGVPYEMKEMMLGTILPDLQRRRGAAAVIRSRVVRTWGLSESGLAEILDARMQELDRVGNPTLAFQASGIEGIKVRVTAKTDDESSALALLDAEEALVRSLIGDHVFGVDGQTMEVVVLEALGKRGLTLAAHETLTGGVLASRMTVADPDMNIFKGAAIRPASHEHGGEEGAIVLAASICEAFDTRAGVAAIAAESDETTPPGTVHLGLVLEDQQIGAT
ncbi:MAG: CinA family nicotinamide mononucleotide deamidase-related protein, partial [Alphaproteobacteria bacterium]